MSISSKLYFFEFCWIMTTVSLNILHVRGLANVLIQFFTNLIQEAEHMMSLDIYTFSRYKQLFKLMNNLCYLKENFSNCFGTQILLNQAMDLIFFLSVAFYILTASLEVNGKPMWILVYLFMIYLLPIIIRELLYITTIDRLGQQVRMFNFYCTIFYNALPCYLI